MPKWRDIAIALVVGIVLIKALEFVFGYVAALPAPWLVHFGRAGIVVFFVVSTLLTGLVPAYIVGLAVFPFVGRVMAIVAAAAVPWILYSLYEDITGMVEMSGLQWGQTTALQATLRSPSVLLSMVASIISVPCGLWLASKTRLGGQGIAP